MVDGDATDCEITHCQTIDSVAGRASKCMISQCMSGDILVPHGAKACTIHDCLVQLNATWSRDDIFYVGGIAKELNEGSLVERCFVAGNLGSDKQNLYFSGITYSCAASTISQCAFGALKLGPKTAIGKRIASDVKEGSKLKDNVVLDCHRGESNPNGGDGKSLSAVLFTQHYLEHSLGWDFETVWQWSDAQKQPELRSVGVDALSHKQGRVAPDDDMDDLLNLQLTANLWL